MATPAKKTEPITVVQPAQFRQAIAQLRIAGRTGRRRRAPNPFPSSIPEQVYLRRLWGFLDILSDRVRETLIPALPAIMAEGQRELGRRADAGELLKRIIGDLTVIFGAEAPIEDIVRRSARQAEEEAGKAQARIVETVLGVRPELVEPWLRPVIADFVEENAKLVQSVTRGFLEDLEARVAAAQKAGLRHEALAKQIEKDFLRRGGISREKARRRARLIARDQTASLMGDVTKARQEQLGVKRFIWRTSQDERVRVSHRQRDGEVFRWDQDIATQLRQKGLKVDTIDGYPGRPINCRCTAEPVLEDLFDDDFEDSERKRAEEEKRRKARERAAKRRAKKKAEEAARRREEERARAEAERQRTIEEQRRKAREELARAQAELDRKKKALTRGLVARYEENAVAMKAVIPKGKGPNEEVLSGLMTKAGAAGELSKKDQARVRREFNEMVHDEGLYNRDLIEDRRKADTFEVFPDGAHGRALAIHNTGSGRIAINGKWVDKGGDLEGIRKFAKTNRETYDGPTNIANAMVHETCHGCSPVAGGAYTGVGVWAEEVSNELASRAIMQRRFGVSRNQMARNGGYTNGINAFMTDVHNLLRDEGVRLGRSELSPGQADTMGRVFQIGEEAGLNMRRDRGPANVNPEQHLRDFANRIVDELTDAELPQQMRGGRTNVLKLKLFRRLRTRYRGKDI